MQDLLELSTLAANAHIIVPTLAICLVATVFACSIRKPAQPPVFDDKSSAKRKSKPRRKTKSAGATNGLNSPSSKKSTTSSDTEDGEDMQTAAKEAPATPRVQPSAKAQTSAKAQASPKTAASTKSQPAKAQGNGTKDTAAAKKGTPASKKDSTPSATASTKKAKQASKAEQSEAAHTTKDSTKESKPDPWVTIVSKKDKKEQKKTEKDVAGSEKADQELDKLVVAAPAKKASSPTSGHRLGSSAPMLPPAVVRAPPPPARRFLPAPTGAPVWGDVGVQALRSGFKFGEKEEEDAEFPTIASSSEAVVDAIKEAVADEATEPVGTIQAVQDNKPASEEGPEVTPSASITDNPQVAQELQDAAAEVKVISEESAEVKVSSAEVQSDSPVVFDETEDVPEARTGFQSRKKKAARRD